MMKMYGASISYYAGKVEAYLRYRGIEYELLSMIDHARRMKKHAGAVQSPVLELDDGRWLSDSTPILAWYDAERDGGPSIYPEDPALRFAALLLEDHADEWLWRPAMHYRWSYLRDREFASGVLTDELMTQIPGPRFLKRWRIARRQRHGFVTLDGVSDANRAHVEASAMAAYDQMEAVLTERPFLFGTRPTNADFGFVGPMLRHFGQDPTPAEIMRQRAPRLFSWVARMWEAAPPDPEAELIEAIDAPLAAMLREACETHLVQLRENAQAFNAGQTHFEMTVQGARYEKLPVSRYRVWCLEGLRRAWTDLDADTRASLDPFLDADATALLGGEPTTESGYDVEGLAPFNRAINVFGDGVPR